ncbi:hypothetical protein JCM8097_001956 [Rhodosporidiobolus ruineniae]
MVRLSSASANSTIDASQPLFRFDTTADEQQDRKPPVGEQFVHELDACSRGDCRTSPCDTRAGSDASDADEPEEAQQVRQIAPVFLPRHKTYRDRAALVAACTGGALPVYGIKMIFNYESDYRMGVECARRRQGCQGKVFADKVAKRWQVDFESTRWEHNHPVLESYSSGLGDEEESDDEIETIQKPKKVQASLESQDEQGQDAINDVVSEEVELCWTTETSSSSMRLLVAKRDEIFYRQRQFAADDTLQVRSLEILTTYTSPLPFTFPATAPSAPSPPLAFPLTLGTLALFLFSSCGHLSRPEAEMTLEALRMCGRLTASVWEFELEDELVHPVELEAQGAIEAFVAERADAISSSGRVEGGFFVDEEEGHVSAGEDDDVSVLHLDKSPSATGSPRRFSSQPSQPSSYVFDQSRKRRLDEVGDDEPTTPAKRSRLDTPVRPALAFPASRSSSKRLSVEADTDDEEDDNADSSARSKRPRFHLPSSSSSAPFTPPPRPYVGEPVPSPALSAASSLHTPAKHTFPSPFSSSPSTSPAQLLPSLFPSSSPAPPPPPPATPLHALLLSLDPSLPVLEPVLVRLGIRTGKDFAALALLGAGAFGALFDLYADEGRAKGGTSRDVEDALGVLAQRVPSFAAAC